MTELHSVCAYLRVSNDKSISCMRRPERCGFYRTSVSKLLSSFLSGNVRHQNVDFHNVMRRVSTNIALDGC